MLWAVFVLSFDTETAFNEALHARLVAGYEPQLAFSLTEVERFLGAPPQDDVARMRYGRRLRDAAPNAAGASGFFAALSKRSASLDDKRFFADASREALRGDPTDAPTLRAWTALLAFFALCFGGCAWFIAHAWFRPISRVWTGLYALAVLGSGAASASSVQTLARARALPAALTCGRLGDAVALLGRDTSFIGALALAFADETDAAEKIFATLPDSADALANLGVLQLADRAKARALFASALEKAPGHVAASYGLWRAFGAMPERAVSDSFRFQHAIRFNAPVLYALPTAADWEQLYQHFQVQASPLSLVSLPLTIAACICALIAIGIGLLRKKTRSGRHARLVAELLAPGAPLPFGFIVTTLVAFFILVPFVAITHPDYLAFYREHLPTPTPPLFTHPLLPLFAVGFSLVAAMRRFRRDW